MSDLEGILETGAAAALELSAAKLSEQGGGRTECSNCGAPMIGAYCAICGQERDTHRRSVWRLVKDYIEDLISFDSRVLRTLRALLLRPGELPLAFREGRTQRYVPAMRLYLFVSLLFFLFLSVTGIGLMQLNLKIMTTQYMRAPDGHVVQMKHGVKVPVPELLADPDGRIYTRSGDRKVYLPGMKADGSFTNNVAVTPVFFQRLGSLHNNFTLQQKKALDSIRKDESREIAKPGTGWFLKAVYTATENLQTNPAALNGPLMTWIPRLVFLLLPLYAGLLFLFYVRKRKDFYYVDHLVFSLNVHTAAFVILVAAAIAAQFLDSGWVGIFVFAALALYVLLAMKRFYAQRWPITIVKYLLAGGIYFLMLLLPALAAAVLLSMIWA